MTVPKPQLLANRDVCVCVPVEVRTCGPIIDHWRLRAQCYCIDSPRQSYTHVRTADTQRTNGRPWTLQHCWSGGLIATGRWRRGIKPCLHPPNAYTRGWRASDSTAAELPRLLSASLLLVLSTPRFDSSFALILLN
ncbi:hypothetical protein TcWFU_005471 [Taenia crassiceps]|uniref:Uncharacterized protein n=1 Tax=Taenia crassiceps TaxID=6207 RepID=A0ABR4Q412_9CEST